MSFFIVVAAVAEHDLKAIRVYDRRRISDAIDEQLEHEPTRETRNRKRLQNVSPDFEFDPPLWELRVGEFRVFYDVDLEESVVYVRAVHRKRPGESTKDALHEKNDS